MEDEHLRAPRGRGDTHRRHGLAVPKAPWTALAGLEWPEQWPRPLKIAGKAALAPAYAVGFVACVVAVLIDEATSPLRAYLDEM